MTTTRARWATDGYDIHVVKGYKLDRYLLLDQQNGSPVPSNPIPADVTAVDFTPTFTGTVFVTTITQSGVQLDRTSGTVEIVGTLGKLRNFILEAKVTRTGGRIFDPRPIRVHVHERLETAWLTPARLTIPLDDPIIADPPNPRGYKLSLLAQFAEDNTATETTVGDITRQSGLLFAGAVPQNITWSSSNPTAVSVDADSGELRGNSAGTATITAHFPLGFQPADGVNPTATVVCRGPWPSVEIQPGSRVSNALSARNVLILPEGFANTERAEFERLAGVLVGFLQSEAVTPLKLLPISYWTAWIDLPTPPSGQPDRGISVLPAITIPAFKIVIDGVMPGNAAIEVPTKPRSAPGALPARIWELEELVYRIGLPMPSDAPALLDPPVPLATKLQEWQTLVGSAAIDATVVNQDLFEKWTALADYRLAEEPDSVFSLAQGARPRASPGRDTRVPSLHPLRMTRAHLDKFLAKLTHKGTPVGSLWTDANRDRYFVLFLCAGSPRGAAAAEEIIAMSLSDDATIDVVAPQGGLSRTKVELKPKPLPRTPSLDARTTTAHELAHVLGSLGDEYGGHPQITAEAEGWIVNDPNLQLAKDLLVGGKIKADAIRWRWPRIRKAALLADALTISGNDVKILLQPGYDARFEKNAFRKGDIVRLRERALERIETVGGVKKWRTTQPSGFRLKLTEDPKPGIGPGNKPVVVITAVPEPPGSPLPGLPSPYKPDDLLIMPLPDPGDPARDLMLMARFVEERLAAGDVPLSRHKGAACVSEPDPGNLRKSNQDDHQFPIRLDESPRIWLKQPWIMQRVVGIYDGGREFHCGVYHPTGACMMRGQFFENNPTTDAYPFCHVCRYILVDKYDPTLHAEIDRLFDKNYAVKK